MLSVRKMIGVLCLGLVLSAFHSPSAMTADTESVVDIVDIAEAADLAYTAETADLAYTAVAADLADIAEAADLADTAEAADLAYTAEAADLADTAVAADLAYTAGTVKEAQPEMVWPHGWFALLNETTWQLSYYFYLGDHVTVTLWPDGDFYVSTCTPHPEEGYYYALEEYGLDNPIFGIFSDKGELRYEGVKDFAMDHYLMKPMEEENVPGVTEQLREAVRLKENEALTMLEPRKTLDEVVEELIRDQSWIAIDMNPEVYATDILYVNAVLKEAECYGTSGEAVALLRIAQEKVFNPRLSAAEEKCLQSQWKLSRTIYHDKDEQGVTNIVEINIYNQAGDPCIMIRREDLAKKAVMIQDPDSPRPGEMSVWMMDKNWGEYYQDTVYLCVYDERHHLIKKWKVKDPDVSLIQYMHSVGEVRNRFDTEVVYSAVYDTENRLLQEETADECIRWAYDEQDHTVASATRNLYGELLRLELFEYNEDYSLVRSTKMRKDGAVYSESAYTYDEYGNLTEMTTTYSASSYEPEISVYSYDEAGRLTKKEVFRGEELWDTWIYDSAGNEYPGDEEYYFLVNGTVESGTYTDTMSGEHTFYNEYIMYPMGGNVPEDWGTPPDDRKVGDVMRGSVHPRDGGLYRIIPQNNKDLSLDVYNASSTPGTDVWVYWANGTNAQQFRISYAADGYYRIQAVCSDLYLTAEGGFMMDANIVQLDYQAIDEQLWRFVPDRDGSFRIYSKSGAEYYDYAMEVEDLYPGSQTGVCMERADGSDQQQWLLELIY